MSIRIPAMSTCSRIASGMLIALAQASVSAEAVLEPIYTDGQVRDVDAPAGRVTLRHGQIDHLGMPPMTMAFRADPDVLAKARPGAVVRFKVVRVDGRLKVLDLDPK